MSECCFQGLECQSAWCPKLPVFGRTLYPSLRLTFSMKKIAETSKAWRGKFVRFGGLNIICCLNGDLNITCYMVGECLVCWRYFCLSNSGVMFTFRHFISPWDPLISQWLVSQFQLRWDCIGSASSLGGCGRRRVMKHSIHDWNELQSKLGPQPLHLQPATWPLLRTLDFTKDTDTFQHLYLGVGALGLSLIFHPNLLLGMALTAGTLLWAETQDIRNSPSLSFAACSRSI